MYIAVSRWAEYSRNLTECCVSVIAWFLLALPFTPQLIKYIPIHMHYRILYFNQNDCLLRLQFTSYTYMYICMYSFFINTTSHRLRASDKYPNIYSLCLIIWIIIFHMLFLFVFHIIFQLHSTARTQLRENVSTTTCVGIVMWSVVVNICANFIAQFN